MATMEMAIVTPIFNREIDDFAQMSIIVRSFILHPHLGFLLVQTRYNS